MRAAIVGTGERAAARAAAVAAAGVLAVETVAPDALGPLLSRLDVVFVAARTADHFRVAEAAAKAGVHYFLEWPPATSVRECEALAALAEEAGVEAGVSRPLRFHPVLARLPDGERVRLIVLRQALPETGDPGRAVADAVDLCCALARSHSVQRVDAEAVRCDGPWPVALAFALRYHSGTYAQVHLRYGAPEPQTSLYVAGGAFEAEADLEGRIRHPQPPGPPPAPPALVHAETHAFLAALDEGRSVPVPLLDGLHSMRLVERLMGRLR